MSEKFIEPTLMSPISPMEARKAHLCSEIPGEVYVVFNRILSSRFGSSITIKQEEVVKEIIKEMQIGGQSVTTQYIFDHHWLDIEPAYEDRGWSVKCYRPTAWEDWKPYWVFSVPGESGCKYSEASL